MKKSPFHKLKIKYLPKKKLKAFKEATHIASLYVLNSDMLEPFPIQESRRMTRIMWQAAELVRARPPVKQISLFQSQAQDTTKNAGQDFKSYVEAYPQLNAYIDYFRLKLKTEKHMKGIADYLNMPVQVTAQNDSYNLQKDALITPSQFAKNITHLGEKQNDPVLQSLGQYFQYKFHRRDERIQQARIYGKFDAYKNEPF